MSIKAIRWPRVFLASLFFGVCLSGVVPAHAALTCSGTVAALDFGNLDPFTNVTASTNSPFNTVCVSTDATTTRIRIFADIGEGSGKIVGAPFSITPRYLLHTDGITRISFNLFANATSVWTASQSVRTTGNFYTRDVPANSTATFPVAVIARIPAPLATTTRPGTYFSTFLNDTDHRIGTTASVLPNSSMPQAMPNFYVNVTAVVDPKCLVTAPSDLDFGSLSLGAAAFFDVQVSNLQVRCTNTTPFQVRLDHGHNSNGTTRQMASTTTGVPDKVAYALYQDAARTQPWGDTLNSDTLSGTGTGLIQNYSVYGRITSLSARPGSYQDTVSVVVTY